MTYLVSHLWLLYLLSILLAGIVLAVIDKPGVDMLTSAAYAAIPDLIALSGLWCFQKGHMLPAVIVAVLCCVVVAAAIWLFWVGSIRHDHLPSKLAGIAAGILCIMAVVLCCVSFAGDLPKILLTSCCLCGMVGVAYSCGYLTAFARGMGGP